MKTMTCKQLGGPHNCNKEFKADTFEEIAEQSKNHGMDMMEQKDPDHLQSMQKMQKLMSTPDAMQMWYDERKAEFEAMQE